MRTLKWSPKRTLSKLHSQGTPSKLQNNPNGSPSKLQDIHRVHLANFKSSTGFTSFLKVHLAHLNSFPMVLLANFNLSPMGFFATSSHPQSFSSQTPSHSNVLSEKSFEVFSNNIPRSSHFLCLIPKLGIKAHSLHQGTPDQTTSLLKVSLNTVEGWAYLGDWEFCLCCKQLCMNNFKSECVKSERLNPCWERVVKLFVDYFPVI